MDISTKTPDELQRAYRKAAIRIVAEQDQALGVTEEAEVELMPDEGGAYVHIEDMWVNSEDLKEEDFATA